MSSISKTLFILLFLCSAVLSVIAIEMDETHWDGLDLYIGSSDCQLANVPSDKRQESLKDKAKAASSSVMRKFEGMTKNKKNKTMPKATSALWDGSKCYFASSAKGTGNVIGNTDINVKVQNVLRELASPSRKSSIEGSDHGSTSGHGVQGSSSVHGTSQSLKVRSEHRSSSSHSGQGSIRSRGMSQFRLRGRSNKGGGTAKSNRSGGNGKPTSGTKDQSPTKGHPLDSNNSHENLHPAHRYRMKCGEIMVLAYWFKQPKHIALPSDKKLIVTISNDDTQGVMHPCNVEKNDKSPPPSCATYGCQEFLHEMGFKPHEIIKQ